MIKNRLRYWVALGSALLLAVGTFQAVTILGASASSPSTLGLRVLLIGGASDDVTTTAWKALLTSEGVPYDTATVTGTSVTLPTLSNGSTGNYNGVVFADSPTAITPSILAPLYSYESTFGVRQVDGYMFPSPALGVNAPATLTTLTGTTGTLTSAGLAALPSLKGPVPFDTGAVGYPATPIAGAPYTPWLTTSTGADLAGVYVHPATDAQAAVSELSLYFDYNSTQQQWLLLGPGIVDWLTQGTHLGLYRNYFGQDIDDVFIADNEWSSTYQCTPGATEPPDYTCPAGVANNPADTPPDVLMSAEDVAYVVNWEAETGIKLNLAFNAVGACTAPSVAAQSSANCTGSVTDNGVTYTDPGYATDDPTVPDNSAFVNALLAAKSNFYWMTHTWSHQFLGCNVWQPQALTSAVAQPAGGTFTAGGYSYVISAATAYGESEPSLPASVTVAANGSVTLTWPEATNGVSSDGTTAGPTLAQEEASHTGGDNFWGYNIYREATGGTTYGLVGQVPELTTATAATTYSFTDSGVAAGEAPGSSDAFPTATNPGINCAAGTGSWEQPTSGADDSSIATEIALDQAFAANNGLTAPIYDPSVLVTGEHSGIDNPNFAAGLAAAGVTTFASDASRQPQAQTIGNAIAAPRYPSNIYYNADNWTDELNEYNTLYVKQGVSIGGTAVGHCTDNEATTCLDAPATEASLLASESHIMLSHVMSNDARVGYAHQSNLIGPAKTGDADTGYIILGLISNMLSQYNSWYSAAAPITQITDPIEAKILGQQAAWASATTANSVSASITNGVVTITNGGASSLDVPITVPPGTTLSGAPFGSAYGGTLSGWNTLAAGASATLTEVIKPSFTSSATAASIVGAPFNFTVSTAGAPTPTITEAGALPTGLTFTANGDGTATITGTPAAGTGASYPITITATNTNGAIDQSFVLTNSEAPAITSPATTVFATGLAGTYTVATTGYPGATISEAGTLPTGLTFLTPSPADGTATISGTTTAAPGDYPVTLQATNSSGSVATLGLTITVQTAAAPLFTGTNPVSFNQNQAGAVALTASGAPAPVITQTGGTLPPGLTFGASVNGTVLISGTPTTGGSFAIQVAAANGIDPAATETYTINVLSTTATINGTVTSASGGAPLPNICVYAYLQGVSTGAAYGTCTNSAGVYQLTDVAPGTYNLAFADPAGGYITQWFSSGAGGAPTQDGAYPIAASAGSVYDGGNSINAVMTGVGTGGISGTVTEAGTGTPLANVCIYLYAPGASGASYATCTVGNGTYSLANVTSGTYNVAYFDPAGAHLTQWHNGTTGGTGDQGSADAVVVPTGNATVSNIDASMAPVSLGNLTGTVTDASTIGPIDGVCVYLYASQTAANASYGTCTVSSGAYSFGSIPAGSYVVAFADPAGTHVTQWYNGGAGGTASQAAAATISVPNGNQTLSAIDAKMAEVGSGDVTGTVTEAGGGTLSNICVYLYPAGVSSGAAYGTCTYANGTYTFNGVVAAGTYNVAFFDPAGVHATQWYTGTANGAATQTGAAPVTVSGTNQVVGNISAALVPVS